MKTRFPALACWSCPFSSCCPPDWPLIRPTRRSSRSSPRSTPRRSRRPRASPSTATAISTSASPSPARSARSPRTARSPRSSSSPSARRSLSAAPSSTPSPASPSIPRTTRSTPRSSPATWPAAGSGGWSRTARRRSWPPCRSRASRTGSPCAVDSSMWPIRPSRASGACRPTAGPPRSGSRTRSSPATSSGPLPGANGLQIFRHEVYVAELERRDLVAIPIEPDGSAGDAADPRRPAQRRGLRRLRLRRPRQHLLHDRSDQPPGAARSGRHHRDPADRRRRPRRPDRRALRPEGGRPLQPLHHQRGVPLLLDDAPAEPDAAPPRRAGRAAELV